MFLGVKVLGRLWVGVSQAAGHCQGSSWSRWSGGGTPGQLGEGSGQLEEGPRGSWRGVWEARERSGQLGEGWPRLSLHLVSGLLPVTSACGLGASSQHGSPQAGCERAVQGSSTGLPEKATEVASLEDLASVSLLISLFALWTWSWPRFKWRKHRASPAFHGKRGDNSETPLNPYCLTLSKRGFSLPISHSFPSRDCAFIFRWRKEL